MHRHHVVNTACNAGAHTQQGQHVLWCRLPECKKVVTDQEITGENNKSLCTYLDEVVLVHLANNGDSSQSPRLERPPLPWPCRARSHKAAPSGTEGHVAAHVHEADPPRHVQKTADAKVPGVGAPPIAAAPSPPTPAAAATKTVRIQRSAFLTRPGFPPGNAYEYCLLRPL